MKMKLTLKQYINKINNWENPLSIINEYIKKSKNESYNAFIRTIEYNDIEKIFKNEWIEIKEDINNYLKKTNLKWAIIWIKDNFLTKWFVTSAWSKMLENYVSPYSSTVYNNLVKAWGIMIWKTNMDEFAMWSSNETSYFWPVKNPIDTTKVPWGSSWWSAVAVASDLCIAALWTDTWWSIRQPASLCWVVWFKPTYWTNSRYWIIAMASSLDQAWTLTKTVEDAIILSKYIASYDENDSTSISRNDIKKWENSLLKKDLKWIKIAVVKEFFWDWLSEEVKNKILEVIKIAWELWANIEEISMPLLKHAIEAYYIIMPAEVSTNLSRFDWIRYWYSEDTFDTKNIYDYYSKVRWKWFWAEAKRRILLWTYVLSAWEYEKYYWQAQKVRKLIKQEFDIIFKNYDLIVWPTSPTTAWNIWEKTNDPLSMYLADIYTVPANLAWLPAISIPVWNWEKTKLPIGFHIIADQFKEEKIFHLANVLENNLNNF